MAGEHSKRTDLNGYSNLNFVEIGKKKRQQFTRTPIFLNSFAVAGSSFETENITP